MGCVQSPEPKMGSMEQLRRQSTLRSGKKKAQQSQDFDDPNSSKPKIMPIIWGEQDFCPRQENYLTYVEPVKPPIPNPDISVQNIIGNPLYDFEGSKEMIPDFNNYKVPKITYPKLELSAIGKVDKKRRQNSEIKQ